MIPIRYLNGDALDPVPRYRQTVDHPAVIAHVVNDVGRYGAGFAGAVAKRYPHARSNYLQWSVGDGNPSWPKFQLGSVQVFPIEPTGLWMAHLLAQRGLRSPRNKVPLDLDSLKESLRGLWLWSTISEAEVHMPEIGCGLAGGSWGQVEPLVTKFLSGKDIPVTVYRLS